MSGVPGAAIASRNRDEACRGVAYFCLSIGGIGSRYMRIHLFLLMLLFFHDGTQLLHSKQVFVAAQSLFRLDQILNSNDSALSTE